MTTRMVRATSRRRMTWTDELFSTDLATGSQTVFSLLGGVLAVDMVGRTLTRLILAMDLYAPDGSSGGVANVFMGIGIASQDAFLGSVVPDPETEGDQPMGGWVWRSRYTVHSEVSNNGLGVRVAEDIRSQRKMQTGELYMVVSNTADQGTTFTLAIRGLARCLWRLP